MSSKPMHCLTCRNFKERGPSDEHPSYRWGECLVPCPAYVLAINIIYFDGKDVFTSALEKINYCRTWHPIEARHAF